MLIRSWHFAFPAEDAAIATLYYPAAEQRLNEAQLTGRVPALEPKLEQGWPLVVIMGGINIAPDSYRWLAQRLVSEGMCVVTYSAIGSLGPAGYGITPGLDLSALAPQNIGSRSCATTLQPLLDRLAGADPDCPVAGLLDLSRIVIGGHSAGGTVALHNSDPAWVPGLRGVFAYGSHTMVAVSLGHGKQTVLAVPSKVPIMLLSGATDNVITASQSRYTDNESEHNPIRRTFYEAITGHQDTWLVELADLGHFGICWPIDHTSGRTFLEPESARDNAVGRALLGDLIAAFVATSLCTEGVHPLDDGIASLDELVRSPLIHYHQRRERMGDLALPAEAAK